MPRQTSKGSRHARRESAFERKTLQHHQFIGESDLDRAEAETRKHDRLEAARNSDVVREMAQQFETLSDKPELRMPRSLDEGKAMLSEAREKLSPQALREKAAERLDQLPTPAKKLFGYAQSIAGFLFAPARLGIRMVRGVVMLPSALLHVLRRQEA